MFGSKPKLLVPDQPSIVDFSKDLVEGLFSMSLPRVSRRLMGLQDDGNVGSLPDFSMEILQACYHTEG